jgi:hypothetical protein
MYISTYFSKHKELIGFRLVVEEENLLKSPQSSNYMYMIEVTPVL